MVWNKRYEVLRFVEQGGNCYKGSDYLEGKLLANYITNTPLLIKEQIFFWLTALVKQVEQYHKCKEQRAYRYVNPYMVVVTPANQIALIDVQAESNRSLVQMMQTQVMREHFFPKGIQEQIPIGMELDIYGIGKSIQYIFAMTFPKPVLTQWEEYTFQKIVKNCLNFNSKKHYKNVSEVLKHFPSMKKYKRGDKLCIE